MFGRSMDRMGDWFTESITDPRFNLRGRGRGTVTAGGPREMYEAIKAKEKELGCQKPEDLTVGFCKD